MAATSRSASRLLGISLYRGMRNRHRRRNPLRYRELQRRNLHSASASQCKRTAGDEDCSSLEKYAWMSQRVPCFEANGDQIDILSEPQEFYETLKKEAAKAKRKVVLASLYLGTGKLEQELVDCIHEACAQSYHKNLQEPLKVTVLLDYTRGSRGQKNSRTMLLPLLKNFEDSVRVALYHTPDLRGLLKQVIPERYNETVGLSHLKVYLFDDTLIISGANLSESYFTNRQDRYIVVRGCHRLADFFSELVDSVAAVSFQLQKDDTVKLSDNLTVHPYKDTDDGSNFKMEAKKRVEKVIKSYLHDSERIRTAKDTVVSHSRSPEEKHARIMDSECEKRKTSVGKANDTWIFPLVQMGPFGICDDEEVTETLLQKAPQGTEIYLASGYFNLTGHYMDVILRGSQAAFSILSASPQVNGFYGARGPAGAIPDAYTLIAKQFYWRVCQHCQQHRIKLHEFFRDKWTFHAKGLWCCLPGQKMPSLTFVGSPNFGYRSVYKDLEAQLAVVTDNKELQVKLHKEQTRLYARAIEVTSQTFEEPDRHVPLWVKFVTPIIKQFF